MIDDTAITLALRNRLLSVSGIPSSANRAFENKSFTPTTGTPYIEEEYVPAPPSLMTIQPDGGTVQGRGFYIVKWYGLPDKGITAIRAGATAILAKFAIGTRLTLANNDVVRIAGKPVGPYAGQIIPTGDGWAVCTIQIPFWILTSNAIAA